MRGLALILSVAVMGLLGLLGAAFLRIMTLERQAAAQRKDRALAVLMARSGLEDALARLSMLQDPNRPGSAFLGEDLDGNGLLSAREREAQVLDPSRLNTADCPVEYALGASFPAREGGLPRLIRLDGRERGLSGALLGGDGAYALKVEDESSKLNLNGGLLDTRDRDADGIPDCADPRVRIEEAPPPEEPPKEDPPEGPPEASMAPRGRFVGWNHELSRLIEQLGIETGLPLSAELLASRPPGGYRDLDEVPFPLPSPDPSPYLTLWSWVDLSVLRPCESVGGDERGCVSPMKRDWGPLELEEGGRPPVNLRGAPPELIRTLVSGLSAECTRDARWPMPLTLDPDPIRSASAALAARRWSEPLDTWGDFSRFCDSLVDVELSGYHTTPRIGGNLGAADLLKANFDPNARLNKQIPDAAMHRWIDKSDLRSHSTEGALSPTGVFTLRAAGSIQGPGGTLRARCTLSCVAEAFRPLRQTTQADFVGGRTLDEAPSYLSAVSSGPPTHGAHAAWNVLHPGQGYGVATYPCPQTALPHQASRVDGAIGLATVEESHLHPAPPEAPAGSRLMFVHHFDDGWDGEDLSGLRGEAHPWRHRPGTWSADLQTDVSGDVWPGPGRGANTLYPDGMHQQTGHAPGFAGVDEAGLRNVPASTGTTDVAPGDHGAFACWIKVPQLSEASGSNINSRFCLSALRTNIAGAGQIITVGMRMGGFCLLVENAAFNGNEDSLHEAQSRVDVPPDVIPIPLRFPDQSWRLVAGRFDTDNISYPHRMSRVWVGDQDGLRVGTSPSGYAPSEPIQQLFEPGIPFVLGHQPGNPALPGPNYRAAQILDEFALYDLSDNYAVSALAMPPLANRRLREGRYYKGDDATFTSTRLTPPWAGPGRLLGASWTATLPSDPRLDVMGLPYYARPMDPAMSHVADPRLALSRVELELLDAAGETLIQPLSQGGRLSRLLPAFRWRARLKADVPDRLNDPALESPWLDDVTFLVQPGTGPIVLRWREGA